MVSASALAGRWCKFGRRHDGSRRVVARGDERDRAMQPRVAQYCLCMVLKSRNAGACPLSRRIGARARVRGACRRRGADSARQTTRLCCARSLARAVRRRRRGRNQFRIPPPHPPTTTLLGNAVPHLARSYTTPVRYPLPTSTLAHKL